MESIPYRIAVRVERNYGFRIKVPDSLSNCKYIKIDLVIASVYNATSTSFNEDAFLGCTDLKYAESLTVPADDKDHNWIWCWMLTNKNNIDATRHPVYLPYQKSYYFAIRDWTGIPAVYRGLYVLELTGVN